VFSIKLALGVTQKKPTIKKKVIFSPLKTIKLKSMGKSSAALTRAEPCASNPHSFEAESGYRMKQ